MGRCDSEAPDSECDLERRAAAIRDHCLGPPATLRGRNRAVGPDCVRVRAQCGTNNHCSTGAGALHLLFR